MFTGIIEAIGTIGQVKKDGKVFVLTIEGPLDLSDTKIGDSIAVDGVCLTVVATGPGSFDVEATPETLGRSKLSGLKAGYRVNLERALRLGDRLGGHIVQGHVEGVGRVARVIRSAEGLIVEIAVPDAVGRYLVDKGSVAVDGTSLTVNSLVAEGFTVNIIGHTEKVTTLGLRRPGDHVNIETDIIGKYIERLLSTGKGTAHEGVTFEKLAEEGYL
jgi:riboflavin synthase